MKKHFKFPVESDLGIGTQYIEFDSDGWPIRQIECYGDQWFNSKQKSGGIDLCDQPLAEFSLELGNPIDSQEFDNAWTISGEMIIIPDLIVQETKISNIPTSI